MRPFAVTTAATCYYAPGVGGIKRYRDRHVCLSVCLSHGAVALGAQLPCLGYRHAGCLHISHVRTADPSADGRRSAASRTAIGGGRIAGAVLGQNIWGLAAPFPIFVPFPPLFPLPLKVGPLNTARVW